MCSSEDKNDYTPIFQKVSEGVSNIFLFKTVEDAKLFINSQNIKIDLCKIVYENDEIIEKFIKKLSTKIKIERKILTSKK